jgi:transcriptional regulator with XRE-family HTH domain
VDYQAEIRDFLTTRRARLTPEQAGVPAYSGTRRVPGLRREEVAHLSGVSVDWYTRLERGKVTGVSAEVLEAVARALQLDDVEREHLFDLVRAARPRTAASRNRRRATGQRLDPGVQAVLDSMTTPALVQNARLDLLATNQLGRAIYPHIDDTAPAPFNFARFVFLDPRARDFYRDWELAARNNAALLRAAAAKDPHDEALIRLVGQLSTQSAEFRDLWASHNVLKYRSCAKRYHHPLVGDLTFGSQQFHLSTDPGLVMLAYTVEAGSPTSDALQLLASWTSPTPPSRVVTGTDA